MPAEIFLLGILIFKGLTVRRIYKSFGVKGLKFGGYYKDDNQPPDFVYTMCRLRGLQIRQCASTRGGQRQT
jgi:hypothetical protein